MKIKSYTMSLLKIFSTDNKTNYKLLRLTSYTKYYIEHY